jgi:hypothetical protein
MFEFRDRYGEDDWDQYAVWTEGSRARTWWTAQPDRDDCPSLGLALAGATGVSGGAAYRVPHLLMPELSKKSRGFAATLIDSPEASEQHCIVMQLELLSGNHEHLWIDHSTHLIRRVVEPRHSLGPPPPEALERLRAHDPEHAAMIAERLADRPRLPPTQVEKETVCDATFDVEIPASELRFIPPESS